MTQKSWPWSTVAALGDGAAELNEADSRAFLAAYFAVQDPAVEGVSKGVGGELAVSGTASPLAVASGSGICYGLYINDAAQNTPAITTPAVGTTGGRVVLQTNWGGTGGAGLEARTRIAVKKSADGNVAIPALTQTFGVTWEISLATFTITTGGVITVTNAPTFRKSTAVSGTGELADLAVTAGKLADNAVTNSKIADLVVGESKLADVSVATAKLQDLTVTSGKLANSAVTNAKVADLAIGESKLADVSVATAKIQNLAVTTGKLAADSVDDTKAGARVPQFIRRQGNSATSWASVGGTSQTPTAVRMQAGANTSAPGADTTITFPIAYSDIPLVFITPFTDGGIGFAVISAISATTFAFSVYDATGTRISTGVSWLSIGPE